MPSLLPETIGDPRAAPTAGGLVNTYSGGIDVAQRICSVDGCGRPHRSKSYCHRHYQRWLKYGDALPEALTPAGRFWAKVERRGDDECWEWQGGRIDNGYGVARTADGRKTTAQRVAWEMANGPIPDGLHVCHRCDNRPCVNPAHLFLGTRLENQADMVAKGRSPRGERQGQSVLTERLVIEIRARAQSGESQRSIAADLGVSQSCIWTVVTRKRWGHVP
jgi:hypothetical protein